MRLNTAASMTRTQTHEGAPAKRMTAMQALRRSVMSALLWEKEFYEDGEEIALRVQRLAGDVPVEDLAALAIELRTEGKLRHMPLLLLSVLARRAPGSSLVSDTIAQVLRRPDEMPELLAIHAHLNGVGPDRLKKVLPAQMKKGVARAFGRFDAYQLAKYDREGPIRLRDVLFLSHAKPEGEAQKEIWEKLIAGKLEAPDTWEVALSAGSDKRETFTRLLSEGKLGYLALLRNLRNMVEAGVDEKLIRDAILARKGAGNVLPFRFTAAARACPRMEAALDEALGEVILEMPRLEGRTLVLVDVSGSMDDKLSGKSDMTRADAAATLGSVIHGDLRVFTFSERTVEVPARRGMAGVDAILRSQPHYGTELGGAVRLANGIPHDRLIVITDEQSRTPVPDPVAKRAYMINVASNAHGVGYGKWTHIDGFSENVLRFIHEVEAQGEAA
ncbi:TROVE domain-containing protein [Cereibacter sphaeroides]|uniref:TROVE domain-containing protein n=1 Tax=Cereibacter sphaeroides TaxID=1063 RepID=UPI001F324D6B|nr:TROVE domain-containing protein [Cereibacter sphaeroides]MCE6959281.1 TROVE domain-containing protein [Cereibacter sphaeroides]MCE6972873.1 TROVE domain-containing protein [Cereibacter sphaeroides]